MGAAPPWPASPAPPPQGAVRRRRPRPGRGGAESRAADPRRGRSRRRGRRRGRSAARSRREHRGRHRSRPLGRHRGHRRALPDRAQRDGRRERRPGPRGRPPAGRPRLADVRRPHPGRHLHPDRDGRGAHAARGRHTSGARGATARAHVDHGPRPSATPAPAPATTPPAPQPAHTGAPQQPGVCVPVVGLCVDPLGAPCRSSRKARGAHEDTGERRASRPGRRVG